MAKLAAPAKRGNHDWGKHKPIRVAPAGATAFELRANELGLSPEMYASSRQLRAWCEANKNRCYIPEWLLKEWGIAVNPDFTSAA